MVFVEQLFEIEVVYKIIHFFTVVFDLNEYPCWIEVNILKKSTTIISTFHVITIKLCDHSTFLVRLLN